MSSFSNNTILAQDMTLLEAKRQYDMEAKNLLSYRCIIAYFLKYCTDEFAGYSLVEIDKCLGGDGKQLTGEGKIQLKSSKDNLPGLVSIELDLCFDASAPSGLKVQVDIEPQKDILPEKVRKNRGCYYCARMISAQGNTVFQNDNYQDMQAVYSIWVIPNAGNRGNTIEEYRMQNVKNADDVLPIVKLMYIYLGDPNQEGIPEILALLDVVFSVTMTIEEIISVLENRFNIQMRTEMKEVVRKMCNFSDVIQERGEMIGQARGEENTKRMVALRLSKMHIPREKIAQVLEVTVEKVETILKEAQKN